ncbi:nephrin [Caerostris extrusa]|uniref:Nephrin n=1 Tax=Caerostris extrusa TaxID=172846 RepID=A0AAV4X6D7_CAEEX|nr:nephrin [Caerostris extrusa]
MIGESSVESQEGGGWKTVSKINVNVTQQVWIYAPDPPNIFGYSEGMQFKLGKLQRHMYFSRGKSSTYIKMVQKGMKRSAAQEQIVSGNIVSKELAIIANANDNGANYHCKSIPPTSLQLKVKPKKPKTGSEVKLICESSSSNPAANITWWKGTKNDEQLIPISVSVTASSEHGGFITKATFVMNVTAEDDGSMCTCQATNEAIQQSVHDTIILPVFYKPIFSVSDIVTYEVKENDSKVIDMNAKANPDKVTCTSGKKKMAVVGEGHVLNITSAERSQSGEYVCLASNDIGESSVTVILKVLYPAVIIKPDDEKEEKIIIAEPESNVKLECSATGYPLTSDTIKWSDEPIIKSSENSTVLSDRGVTAKLYCTAEEYLTCLSLGLMRGVVITDSDSRIKNDVVKVDYVTWQGILTVNEVVSTPDPPLIVRILNTSKESLFYIGFRDLMVGTTKRIGSVMSVLDPVFYYIDVHPPATNSVWVSGLQSATEYEIAMKSINEKGSSSYTTEIVKAVTLDSKGFRGKSKRDPDLSIDFLELIAGSIGAVFLLLIFNIVLLAMYYHKRFTNDSKPESEETTFTEYSSETVKDNTISYDTISINTKSDESYSSTDEISQSSTSSSSVPHYKSRHAYGDFI